MAQVDHFYMIYLCGIARKRMGAFPRGAKIVFRYGHKYPDTREGYKAAHAMADQLEVTLGYAAVVFWCVDHSWDKLDRVFYHPWFFN